MIRVLTLVGTVLLCAATATAEEKLTLKELEGTWVMVRLMRGDNKAPPALLKRANIRLKIEGDQYSVTSGEENEPVESGTLTLDTSVTPHILDQHLTGEEKRVEYGIVRLQGGKLLSCEAEFGSPRPKKFASPKDSTDSLAEFERVAE